MTEKEIRDKIHDHKLEIGRLQSLLECRGGYPRTDLTAWMCADCDVSNCSLRLCPHEPMIDDYDNTGTSLYYMEVELTLSGKTKAEYRIAANSRDEAVKRLAAAVAFEAKDPLDIDWDECNVDHKVVKVTKAKGE